MTQFRKSVTRDDVAREAGVSPTTVSYVVNHGPRHVTPETRQKVLQAIEKLGYKPNILARSLRLRRTTSIGLILPDTINPYFAEVVYGVEKVAFERNYSVFLCHSEYSPDRELQYINSLYSKRVAGVLWFPATGDNRPAQLLDEFGVPLVILDRSIKHTEAPTVVTDNYLGGYDATQHLISLGHRLIGCIARPVDLYHSHERVRGYLAAHADNQLPTDEDLIVRGGFRLGDGRRATHQLLKQKPQTTAIFAYNDVMALGSMRACWEMGLRVPEDVSIVGFDDIPQSSYLCPALTTIRQPKFDMGKLGAEFLLDLVEGKAVKDKPISPLEVELIIRESTGQVRATEMVSKQNSLDVLKSRNLIIDRSTKQECS